MEAVSNFMWPTEICQASLMKLLANVSQHSLCPCVFEKSLQHLTCVWIQKVKWRLHFFHAHLFICFLSPLFFSRIFSAFRSWLELSVGHRHTSRPTHAGCSTVVTQLITWLRITPEWTFGRAAQFFFVFSLVQLDAWKNWETYQSVATRNTFWGEKEEVQEEKEQRERERRKTSPCNLLPQHSVSDVVWHLVHKANQIHTLPSYISGNGVSGGRVMGNESKRQKLGAGDRGGGVDGGAGGWMCVWGGVKKKGKSKSFVFTHTESLPETLDHISDSLLSSLLTQSHVKDWWARWWTKINQSHSHSHRQTAREAGEQPGRPSSVSKTRPRFSLAKSRSLLFPFFFLFFLFFPQWSFSSSLLPSFVSVMAALDCCFDRSIQRLAEKKLGGQTDDPRTV